MTGVPDATLLAGETVPQPVVGFRLTLTPLLAASFVTVGVICSVCPASMFCSIFGDNVTTIAGFAVIFSVAVFVLSATEVAVTITAQELAKEVGAV